MSSLGFSDITEITSTTLSIGRIKNGYVINSDGGGGVSDHGDLTGLSDDDHTQYLLADGSRNATTLSIDIDLNVGRNLQVNSTSVMGGNVDLSGNNLVNVSGIGGNGELGDMVYRNASEFISLSGGTDTQVLQINSSVPSWVDSSSVGVTDHGDLTGLSDDDHTQYLLVNGNRAMTDALEFNTTNEAVYLYSGSKSFGLGSRNIIIGQENAFATNDDTIVIGNSSTSTGSASICIGLDTTTSGSKSIAIGQDARSTSSESISIGPESETLAARCVAIGFQSQIGSSGTGSVCYGSGSNSTIGLTTSIGSDSSCGNSEGIALGYNARTNAGTGGACMQIGNGTNTEPDSIQISGVEKLLLPDFTQTNGQVLQTNGTVCSFGDVPAPTPTGFEPIAIQSEFTDPTLTMAVFQPGSVIPIDRSASGKTGGGTTDRINMPSASAILTEHPELDNGLSFYIDLWNSQTGTGEELGIGMSDSTNTGWLTRNGTSISSTLFPNLLGTGGGKIRVVVFKFATGKVGFIPGRFINWNF